MNKLQQAAHRKRLAYIRTFCGDGEDVHVEGKQVLADLRRFCRINRGGLVISPKAGLVDPYATVYAAGLRDAYLRIIGFLELDEAAEITTPGDDDDRPDTANDDT